MPIFCLEDIARYQKFFAHNKYLVNHYKAEGGLRSQGVYKRSLPAKPLITIITVVFNGAETLPNTIESILNQNYDNIEHIVVDGGSSDATANILRQYDHVIDHWLSEKDSGIYDAMNKGIALATGEIIGTLNADDFYADNTVLTQVATIFSDPTVDACFADLIYVDKFNLDKIVRYWKSNPFQSGLFNRGWMPAHPTFFVRRRIYEQYGEFDLNFPRQADFELSLRFLEVHKIKSIYVPNIWVKMRIGGVSNNSFRGIIKGNIEAYHACRKNGLDVEMLPFILRKMLSRVPQFFKKPESRYVAEQF